MKSIIRNLFLVVALSAVIIMVIGIALYDYIPTSATVAKANTYEVKESTTKILSEITENSQNLVNPDSNTSSDDSATPNVILQTYSVTKNDLAVYQSSGDYEKGKSNPFADAAASPSGSNTGSSNTNNNNNNSNSNNTVSEPGTTGNTNSSTDLKPNTSDGTLFNSTTSK